MAWNSWGGRAPRFFGAVRALGVPAARRIAVAGGFVVAAWAFGASAPACADAFDTTAEASQAVVEAAAAHRAAGARLAAVDAAAESAIAEALRRTPEAVPVPVIEHVPAFTPGDLVDARVLSLAADPGPAPGEDRGATRQHAPAAEPTSAAPAAPAAPAEPARTRDRTPVGGPAQHDAAATETAEGSAAPRTGTESRPDSQQSTPAHTPQSQNTPSTGLFAGYLTQPPAAPRRDALTSEARHALVLVPLQHADEHFFSPD